MDSNQPYDWSYFSWDIEYFREKSFLIYNLIYSILSTFRWDKNLQIWVNYISKILQNYKLSNFYLFRVRNLFLYYYQTIIWRNKFYYYLSIDKEKIISSKYMKLIFSDLKKAEILNHKNPVIDTFKWVILLHLLDEKWVDLLIWLKNKINNDCFYWDILIWISNYYLDIWDYKKSEEFLNTKWIIKSFKYYRKIFPVYILTSQKDKLFDLIIELVEKKKEYSICFFIKNSLSTNYKTILFDEVLISNDNINLPLDINLFLFE